ncbi:MAG: hypothetical protein JWO98_4909 [Frankiales bacterium]|nr:hypothetical protein [Frankiales bacterium]
MSALLVYKNERPEVLAWAVDVRGRITKNNAARFEWMTALYDAHGVPDDDKVRGAFSRGCEFSGISWPDSVPLPAGWFRPVKTPQLVRPRHNSKAALAEMARFNRPDARGELAKRFGMPEITFVGNGLYTNGLDFTQDDAVWVTWGTRDAVDKLGDVESHGWVRVPLVEYIERFGEDAL